MVPARNQDFRDAVLRYRRHRKHARALLEEDLLAGYRRRIDVLPIDDHVLALASRDWYSHPARRVNWDWKTAILSSHHRRGPRGIDLAFIDKGQLCGLAVARVSRRKTWLSLTHIEGAPTLHPLKGEVLPIVIQALEIYSTLIAADGERLVGIRVLNPTEDAMVRYQQAGYPLSLKTKKLRAMVIHPRTGVGHDHCNEEELSLEQ